MAHLGSGEEVLAQVTLTFADLWERTLKYFCYMLITGWCMFCCPGWVGALLLCLKKTVHCILVWRKMLKPDCSCCKEEKKRKEKKIWISSTMLFGCSFKANGDGEPECLPVLPDLAMHGCTCSWCASNCSSQFEISLHNSTEVCVGEGMTLRRGWCWQVAHSNVSCIWWDFSWYEKRFCQALVAREKRLKRKSCMWEKRQNPTVLMYYQATLQTLVIGSRMCVVGHR